MPIIVESYSPIVGEAQEVVKQISEHLGLRGRHVIIATTRLYRWKEIALLWTGLSFSNPNILEAQISSRISKFRPLCLLLVTRGK
jgi:hypothetical protein